jgi:hypothetical protein
MRRSLIESKGWAVRPSQARKAAKAATPNTERGQDLGASPADVVRPDEPPGESDHGDRAECNATDVDRLAWAERLGKESSRKECRHDADRDVDPEDPVPVDSFRDRAADDRPKGNREAGEAAVDAEDRCSPLGGERLRQDRQAQRQDHGAAEALDRACADQHRRARRESASRRRRGEQNESQTEESPPAETVAERGGADNSCGDGDVVGVDRPLQVREADVQRFLDARQRSRDNQCVETGHEERGRAEHEHPAEPGPPHCYKRLGHRVSSVSRRRRVVDELRGPRRT